MEPNWTQGRQRILQRTMPCTCGCKGRDSWHSRRLHRLVTDVVALETPVKVQAQYGELGFRPLVNALGRFNHPSGELRWCGLECDVGTAGLVALRWVAVDAEAAKAALVAHYGKVGLPEEGLDKVERLLLAYLRGSEHSHALQELVSEVIMSSHGKVRAALRKLQEIRLVSKDVEGRWYALESHGGT